MTQLSTNRSLSFQAELGYVLFSCNNSKKVISNVVCPYLVLVVTNPAYEAEVLRSRGLLGIS